MLMTVPMMGLATSCVFWWPRPRWSMSNGDCVTFDVRQNAICWSACHWMVHAQMHWGSLMKVLWSAQLRMLSSIITLLTLTHSPRQLLLNVLRPLRQNYYDTQSLHNALASFALWTLLDYIQNANNVSWLPCTFAHGYFIAAVTLYKEYRIHILAVINCISKII